MTIRPITALCALLIAAGSSSVAAQAYPNKPIRLIFPYQAGGAGEIVFRTLMPTFEQRL